MVALVVNYMTVLIAAVSAMALGFLWYSPVLFGKPWMKLMGITDVSMSSAKKKGMAKMYAISFLGSLVMAYVLAHFVQYTSSNTYILGATLGFWIWLGFVGPVQMTDALFGAKPWKLYFINIGYQLVSLMLMGAILAGWG